jgi:integrase
MRGQIVKRGDYYSVVISYKDPLTGKWKKQWTAAGTSSRKADDLKTKLLNEAKGGVVAKPGRITYSDHLKSWLKDVSVQTLAPRTLENYEYNSNKYILPKLAQIPIAGLTPKRISTLLSDVLGPEGTRIRTVQLLNTILHKSLDYAVKQGLIIRNPIDAVDPPKTKRREMNTLSEKEAILALELARNSVFFPLFHVAMFSGLRRGELLGLKWGDIDLMMSRISVQRALSQTHYGKDKGKVKERAPKTAKGKRLVQIGSSTVEVLRQHYEKQKQLR